VKQPGEPVQQLEEAPVEHKERVALPEERVADTEKEEAVDGLQVLPEIRTPAVAAQWDRTRSHSRGMEALKVRQDDEKMRAENCTIRKPDKSLPSEWRPEILLLVLGPTAPRKRNVRKERYRDRRRGIAATGSGKEGKQRGLKRPECGRGLRQGR